MPFCNKCGAEYKDGANFCPSCGNDVSGNSEAGSQNKTENDFTKTFNEFNNTADHTTGFDSADIEQNKIMSLFSYLGLLVLIPLLAAQSSRYARFHVNQGLLLLITGFVLGVLSSILSTIFGLLGLGLLGYIISIPVSLLILALMVIGIINAVNGKAKELPVIGRFVIYK